MTDPIQCSASHTLRSPSLHFATNGMAGLSVLNEMTAIPVFFDSSREFDMNLSGYIGQSVSIWSTSSNAGFHSKPKYHVDKSTIRLVLAGDMTRVNKRNEHASCPGRAMFVAFEDMIFEQASLGFEAMTATIDNPALQRCYLHLEGDTAGPFPHFLPVVDINTIGMKAFARNLHMLNAQLMKGLSKEDLYYPLLEEMFIYHFLSVWPQATPTLRSDQAPRLARQTRCAIDYIESRLKERMTIAEVAGACGVSVRLLQLNFQKDLGFSPLQYIINRRLDRIRADLSTSGHDHLPLSVVARQWGFVHMSDFSKRFQLRFGCSPSHIRKRS